MNIRQAARLYSFRPGVDNTWTVADTPTYHYALVEHDSQLLLVGGQGFPSEEITNKIFTLINGEFIEKLPHMRVNRQRPCAVSNGSILVVAGGHRLSSVEVLLNGQWVTAPSLPKEFSPLFVSTSTLCKDRWYLFYPFDAEIFHVCLHSLLSKEDQSPWEPLLNAPKQYSTVAFWGDHLLSIGGGFGPLVSAIYAFLSHSQSWEHVADLPVPLSETSAVELSTRELIVAGGEVKRGPPSNRVFRGHLKGLCYISNALIQICIGRGGLGLVGLELIMIFKLMAP